MLAPHYQSIIAQIFSPPDAVFQQSASVYTDIFGYLSFHLVDGVFIDRAEGPLGWVGSLLQQSLGPDSPRALYWSFHW